MQRELPKSQKSSSKEHGSHSVKDITVTLPRDKLIVITGVSGSGKSTLAYRHDSMPGGGG